MTNNLDYNLKGLVQGCQTPKECAHRDRTLKIKKRYIMGRIVAIVTGEVFVWVFGFQEFPARKQGEAIQIAAFLSWEEKKMPLAKGVSKKALHLVMSSSKRFLSCCNYALHSS